MLVTMSIRLDRMNTRELRHGRRARRWIGHTPAQTARTASPNTQSRLNSLGGGMMSSYYSMKTEFLLNLKIYLLSKLDNYQLSIQIAINLNMIFIPLFPATSQVDAIAESYCDPRRSSS